MPRKLKMNGPATPEQLQVARKSHPDPHDQERLQAMQMAHQGTWSVAEIGKAVDRGRATIVRWLKRYREGGVARLIERANGHRQAQLDADDIQALEEELRKGRFKNAKEIRQWLEEERDITMSRWGVYYWLKKVKASFKKPRPKHRDQDADEVE